MSEPKSQWQPIETAPRDGTAFIGGEDGEEYGYISGCVAQTMWFDENGRLVSFMGSHRCMPTHWMPIPPLPEGRR